MLSTKALIGNELMKEIISIRIDTLWKMLGERKKGTLPDVYEEGATGKFDNKGAILIPGGLVHQDVDEKPIQYQRHTTIRASTFRKKIRDAMQYDNATLLFPDGIASGINLDSGFFSKAAKRIYTFKKAAFRRKPKIGVHSHLKVDPDDIIRSHCPPYMQQPHGARTRISTCVSLGLVDPPLFFAYCESELNLSRNSAKEFAHNLDGLQDPVKTHGGKTLYSPCVIVCHDTRHKDNSLTGLTRVLGIGKFGEFATLTFEQINRALLTELKRKKQSYSTEDIVAEYDDTRILGIMRIYAQTNPGKRSQNYLLQIVSPKKHLDIDLERLEHDARNRYRIPA